MIVRLSLHAVATALVYGFVIHMLATLHGVVGEVLLPFLHLRQLGAKRLEDGVAQHVAQQFVAAAGEVYTVALRKPIAAPDIH